VRTHVLQGLGARAAPAQCAGCGAAGGPGQTAFCSVVLLPVCVDVGEARGGSRRRTQRVCNHPLSQRPEARARAPAVEHAHAGHAATRAPERRDGRRRRAGRAVRPQAGREVGRARARWPGQRERRRQRGRGLAPGRAAGRVPVGPDAARRAAAAGGRAGGARQQRRLGALRVEGWGHDGIWRPALSKLWCSGRLASEPRMPAAHHWARRTQRARQAVTTP